MRIDPRTVTRQWGDLTARLVYAHGADTDRVPVEQVLPAAELNGDWLWAVYRDGEIVAEFPIWDTAGPLDVVIDDPFQIPQTGKWAALSPAEREVLRMLMDGLTFPEIAEARFVAPSTIAKQVRRLRTKMGGGSTPRIVAETYRKIVAPE